MSYVYKTREMATKDKKQEWFVSDLYTNGIFIKSGIGAYEGAICRVYTNNVAVKSIDEALANAKLIASAPQLLSALEDMLALFARPVDMEAMKHPTYLSVIKDARATIESIK